MLSVTAQAMQPVPVTECVTLVRGQSSLPDSGEVGGILGVATPESPVTTRIQNQDPFYQNLLEFLQNELTAIQGSLSGGQQPALMDRDTVRSWLQTWVRDTGQTIDRLPLLYVLRWLYRNQRAGDSLQNRLATLIHLVSQSPVMGGPTGGESVLVRDTTSLLRESLRAILEGLDQDSVGAGVAWDHHIDRTLENIYVLLQLEALSSLLHSSSENNRAVFAFMERSSIIVSSILPVYTTSLSRSFLASQLYFLYARSHSVSGAESSSDIIRPYINLLSIYGRLSGDSRLVRFTEQTEEINVNSVDQIVDRYTQLERGVSGSTELSHQLRNSVSHFLTYPLESVQSNPTEPFHDALVSALTEQINQRSTDDSFDETVFGSVTAEQHNLLRALAAKAAKKTR
ncbi:hypothetical protein NX722_20165 [Endozoicomonas gorgoniicola]|uniref:Uncharacterized protein n=1 Tax=Endozoicomonas gorgoniicola TaxID=1234144 RepID=A0ABT3MZT2_9GAMM|nr:hypothetical protein [Endozoicomonas gorgoniicola]MCW7554890.1 hypothetical protein [Endozoicomonas gorgoniicola]